MKTVAVLSALGGAGGTTVAAHLASALTLQKRNTLSFDWCPENRLRLHFGMRLDDGSGWSRSLLDGGEWQASAYNSGAGVPFVPFGLLANDRELDQLVERLRSRPDWFASQLDLLRLADDAIVVCDCPRLPAVLRDQVLATADLVLIICSPDTVSYAAATHMAATAKDRNGPPGMVVLSGFDSSRRLDRDVSVLLRNWHGPRVAPVLVHRDEALREALACKQTVFEFAPSSLAAYDFAALATWTLARLGHAGHEA